MKKLAVALAFGAVLTTGAAFADTVQNGYGNTFVITAANGAVLRYHFNADNTFTLFAPDASQVSGAYEVANGQICLTPAGGERACTSYVGDKNVGDTWTQTGADGSQITVTLQAGR